MLRTARAAEGNGNQTLVLVDGSLLAVLPRLMEASWLKSETGSGVVKWRLHTHFEVDRYVSTQIDVTRNGGGENDERAVLERTIEPDRLDVADHGYAKFKLFKISSPREAVISANCGTIVLTRSSKSGH